MIGVTYRYMFNEGDQGHCISQETHPVRMIETSKVYARGMKRNMGLLLKYIIKSLLGIWGSEGA